MKIVFNKKVIILFVIVCTITCVILINLFATDLKSKITISDLSDQDAEQLKSLILNDKQQNDYLKKSNTLTINKNNIHFCTKHGASVIGGKYNHTTNDPLYISFIKNESSWSVCSVGTAP